MIIQIAGTSGAGKSYVVRHLIANSRYVATIKPRFSTGINVKVEGVVRCVNRWKTKSLTRHPTRNDSQS